MSLPSSLRLFASRVKCQFKALGDLCATGKMSRKAGAPCPVCGARTNRAISYACPAYITGPSSKREEVRHHEKSLCEACGHLFTDWLDEDVKEVGTVYEGIYSGDHLFKENPRAAYQLGLLRYAISHLKGMANPSLLDFGCGPNLSPSRTLREEGIRTLSCDILPNYPYDGQLFFRYDPEDRSHDRQFDAIISIDVIEHLGNTLDAWKSLNRMLRPNGIMAHSFPSRIHFSLLHDHCAAPFHTSLFTRRSLDILTAKAGFSLEAIEPFPAGIPYVFRFRKVQDA
jgi:SAM-dependent methyltransferase